MAKKARYFIIDHENKLQIIDSFVLFDGDTDITQFKVTVKERNPFLDHIAVDALVVWRFKDQITTLGIGDEREVVINGAFSHQKVEVLSPRQAIAGLNLSEEEILLVKLPKPIVSQVWCLIIDHKETPFQEEFWVSVDTNIDIAQLKVEVKKKESLALDRFREDDFVVWRLKDRSINLFIGDQAQIIKDAFLNKKVEKLGANQVIANLNLLKDEILLVQTPGSVAFQRVECHMIDHTNEPVGEMFDVLVNSDIEQLKVQVKNEGLQILDGIDAKDLMVWRFTDKTTNLDTGDRAEIIKDAFLNKKVKKLGVKQVIASLSLSEEETLLVQVPAPTILTAGAAKRWVEVKCLVIDDQGIPVDDISVVVNTNIAELKDEIKMMSQYMSHIDTNQLEVWKFKDRSTVLSGEDDEIEATIKLAFYKNMVKELAPELSLIHLKLREKEKLLVKLPALPPAGPAAHQVWCQFIDDDYAPVGKALSISVDAYIAELKDRLKTYLHGTKKGIPANKLKVWRLKDPIINSMMEDRETRSMIRNAFIGNKVRELHMALDIARLRTWSKEEVLFVSVHTTSLSTGSELPKSKPKTTKRLSPSEASKHVNYSKYQEDLAQTIHDGLVPNGDNSVFTTALPIHVYHPIFAEFTSLANNAPDQPPPEDLVTVKQIMDATSLLHDSEDAYLTAVDEPLVNFFGPELKKIANFDNTSAHRVIGDSSAVFLLLEAKIGIASSNSDATILGGIHMRRYWEDLLRQETAKRYCCPTFILVMAGPWMCVMGGVITDKVIVQRLTDLKWTALSITGGPESRITEIANIFATLRTCVNKLRKCFASSNLTDDSMHTNQSLYPVLARNKKFPYPTHYTTEDGENVVWKYIKPLQEWTVCVTFLAEVVSGDKLGKVVVKFVSRYGGDVHKYLASKRRAPQLHYFGPIPGLEGASGVQNVQMVVMEYIETKVTAPQDVFDQIEEILTDLHSEGYVFGDLREPNILFDQDDRVILIDFNWCGRYNMHLPHERLPKKVLDQVHEKVASGIIPDGGEYVRYPLMISNAPDMWADGMSAYAFILPEHDWAMRKRLCYEWSDWKTILNSNVT